ncbi:Kinesin-like protein klp-20 [Caenorhabditis elegans]|uniref:Kinesin-like protein klp-20 n=2 Tax=Caenorhabditis elegans TaxID=6239 RepID=KLP20_CAEEL|nr:Kinesin-like protein klp-20 [Caenorhabditis elegans]Q965T6.1 RecName: Full=Kinesin-like protein klp-20 [Caenorhabditis elegans]CCD73793.1 Kinesin-like protein klp-20 [Caenorhabditis elegans]|eukprot:NP_497178.1 Kinesin-like protein klp-20 [Caenorhabditis elegans]
MEGAEKVKVVVRCRPISTTEKLQGHKIAVTCNDEEKAVNIKSLSQEDPPRTFYFDAVFSPNTDQMTVYNVAARPIVENVLKGYNGTIFAYGQTGTGKTFTMAGDLEPVEMRGIIPNSFAHIFDHIAKCQHDTTFLVRVSYLEIYNEEIRDLLSKDHNGNLEIKERPDVGVYVRNLSNPTVENASKMQALMEFGSKNRKVGATAMNLESSRSHAMFTVTIESCRNGLVTQGKLQLVDLAGSERQSKTGAQGERLKEAAKINLSLSTLGNVISSLVDGKSTHIPYRNSKLTRLLQDSLGGNSKTVMIANVGPATYNYDETLSTLRYANRAKNIQNVAKINEDPKDAQLRKFQLEIEALRKILDEENPGDDENQEEAWEAKMQEREVEMEKKRKILEERVNSAVNDEETHRLVKEMMENEAELKKARSEHEKLRSKLEKIEKKLIVGGENLLEKVEEQAKLLEVNNKELEQSKFQEAHLRTQLEERTAVKVEIEERYSSLQEEAFVKSKKIKKVSNELKDARAELKDLEEDHQRQVEAMLDDIRQLRKELLLNIAIIDEYIPVEHVELIEKYVSWSEEHGDWQLKAIAYTGNNMRASAPPAKKEFSNNNQTVPMYYSYRADLGASTAEHRPRTSSKKHRASIRLQQLLT